jgi:hypothetical protein
MMIVTKEEFLLAAFSLRIHEIFRLHNMCADGLHPELLQTIWNKAVVEKKTVRMWRNNTSQLLEIEFI